MSLHGTSPVKNRPRRSRAEVEALDRGLCEIVGEHAPITIRCVFYRAVAGDGRPTYVYLLTDFDPSGLGIAQTLSAELARRSGPVKVHVERLTVSREQIDAYELPTRPTKRTDARASKLTEEQGTDSVDLDALPPDVLRALVRESIEQHMEPGRLDVLRLAEEQERDVLREALGGVV